MTHITRNLILVTVASLSLLSAIAGADEKSKAATQAAPSDASNGEKVNVDAIKERYWARGDEAEIGVVQNRLYSKAKKFELSVFGGVLTTDPFLSVQNLGASFGYHFNEYIGLHLVTWRSYVSPSSATVGFQEAIQAEGGIPAVPTTNNPLSFLGGEIGASVLYGKLSVVGKAIIYYDLHLLGGAGSTHTESGRYFTPYVGIGQQVYLSKTVSLVLDYRLMRYQEVLLEKTITSRIGQPLPGSRANYTNAITLGLSFLIGGIF